MAIKGPGKVVFVKVVFMKYRPAERIRQHVYYPVYNDLHRQHMRPLVMNEFFSARWSWWR